ncbi:MAG: flagellar basal-body MS-ring/collar protein FliF, partial [Bdellovibrionota bacterium]
MNEYFRKILTQISDFLGKLSPAKKVGMGATAFALVFAMSGIFFWAGDKTYSPLMSNLNPEDAANIIRVLREKHIPFKLDPSGKNISIPPESVYELRLELATMGMPQSSIVGYEVFDKTSLGTTSFVQKVNQKRALEGELMRTISTIRGVKRARVHLAIPQKSTFVEDQKKSTASVVLDLDPGTKLNDKQVFGVGNLVAKAVEGMEASDVVIMDSNGKVLSKNPTDSLAAATASQLDYQQKVEAEIEKHIEAILSRVVGEGKVVAKVTADLEFSQVNETQTTYDQDGSAVRSIEKRNDNMNMVRPGPFGVTGQVANNPGQPPASNGDVKNDTNKNHEVTNYEVPQTVRRTTRPQGAVKRISVAVVVDGKTVKTVGKDGVVQSKVEGWGAPKLKEFEDVVASAVGLDRKRGDTL